MNPSDKQWAPPQVEPPAAPPVSSPTDGSTSSAAVPSIANTDMPSQITGRVFPRQISSGSGRGIQQFGSPNLFVDSGNNYFGVSKDGIQQVLMGLQPTFGEGFYVTRDGIDVSQTTSTDDFIFNSNQDIFKIVKPISLTIPAYTTATASAGFIINDFASLSVPHGLNYIPAFQAFGNISGGFVDIPRTIRVVGVDSIDYAWATFQVTVDSTNVTFQISFLVSAIGSMANFFINVASSTVKVYLLQESITI